MAPPANLKSPFGVPGAVVGLALSLVFLGALLYLAASEPDYWIGMLVGLLCVACGALSFACADHLGLKYADHASKSLHVLLSED